MRESVPSQSVDYCITVLSGWIDDVIALSSPKTLFSASKGAGIVAFPGVLLRFWQSCGYGYAPRAPRFHLARLLHYLGSS